MFTGNLCGVNTGHRRGFIHKTEASPHYLLMVFRTPFFAIVDGRRLEGSAGDVILHRPGEKIVHGPLSEDTAFVNDWIYFSDGGDGSIESLSLPFGRIVTVDAPERIGELIGDVIEEGVRADAYSPRLISDAIYRMLVAVSRMAPEESREDQTILARFREARVYILHHYGEPWTLERMAERTGYSVSRFCTLYSEFFGISPMNDLLEARLEMAKQLLSLHAYKVGDVAELCGFSSIHYFSNFMKKHTGKAPSAF